MTTNNLNNSQQVEISEVKRRFVIEKTNTQAEIKLTDPDPTMPLTIVQNYLSTMYPQLTTATMHHSFDGEYHVYSYKSTLGTKG